MDSVGCGHFECPDVPPDTHGWARHMESDTGCFVDPPANRTEKKCFSIWKCSGGLWIQSMPTLWFFLLHWYFLLLLHLLMTSSLSDLLLQIHLDIDPHSLVKPNWNLPFSQFAVIAIFGEATPHQTSHQDPKSWGPSGALLSCASVGCSHSRMMMLSELSSSSSANPMWLFFDIALDSSSSKG